MIKGKLKSIRLILGLAVACVLLAAGVDVASASAEVQCASCTPWWQLGFQSVPANLPPGGEGEVDVVAEDLGDAPPNGSSSVVLTEKLPAGLTAKSVRLVVGKEGQENAGFFGEVFCHVLPGEVVCTLPGEVVEAFLPRPYGAIETNVKVSVAANAKSGEATRASIVAGATPRSSRSGTVTVSSAP